MKLSSTIRGILINLIKFTVSPSHFYGLMSVTIEGTFKEITKSFADDPLKTILKSPVIVEADKFILIIFIQLVLKDSRKFPLLLREHKKIKKVLSFTPTLCLPNVRYY